jgi:AcrR family transcriptional regulator
MSASSAQGLKPRKTPRQARSEATVESIFDATIQVLLAGGVARLTTTRVAERAGVSVGTMYQYFPHKQALLHAVLKRHLEGVVDAVELAGGKCRGQKVAAISDALVAAYLDAKMANFETTRALYRVAPELDLAALQNSISARIDKTVTAALASASDAAFADIRTVAITLQAVVTGAIRTVLERGASPALLKIIAGELPKMCRVYLRAAAKTK